MEAENLNSQVINEKEILGDLKDEFKSIGSTGAGPSGIQVETIPSFLPLQLIRVVVAGKNAAIVSHLSKNVSLELKDSLKEAFKPSDNEVDIYKRLLEAVLWKYFPQIAQWFMKNDAQSIFAEAFLLESIRVVPWMPVVYGKEDLNPEKKAV